MTAKPLVFPLCPANKVTIDAVKQGPKRSFVVGLIVLEPALNDGMVVMRQVFKAPDHSIIQPPAKDHYSHTLYVHGG